MNIDICVYCFDSVDQCIILSEVLTHVSGPSAEWYIVVICITDTCAVLPGLGIRSFPFFIKELSVLFRSL